MSIQIVNIDPDNHTQHEQMARTLTAAFAENYPTSWATHEEAIAEVHDFLNTAHICCVAVDETSTVLGWIGGISMYEGNVWELHPLAVHPDHQGKGVGRLLVEALEREVAARGGLTIYLGSDDESGLTSLAGADLYDSLWDKIAHIRNLKNHPFSFYERAGFQIVGVVPDANGVGKPDIMMAKRVHPK